MSEANVTTSAGAWKQSGLDRRASSRRRIAIVGALFWSLLIAYGSLLPFDLRWPDEGFSLLGFLLGPGGVSDSGLASGTGRADIAMNLVLYVPLGLWLAFALGKPRYRPVTTAIAATFAALTVSWGVEALQAWSPTRTASWRDIGLNTVAAGFTALFADPLAWATGRVLFFARMRLTERAIYFRVWMGRQRRRPSYAIAALLTASAGVVGFRLTTGGDHGSLNWMPLYTHYLERYDIAVIQIGIGALAYALATLLLISALVGKGSTFGLKPMLGLTVGLALCAEALRYVFHMGADVSEVVLATAGATVIVLAVDVLRRVIPEKDRRSKKSSTYTGPDRRKRQYEYKPAVHAHLADWESEQAKQVLPDNPTPEQVLAFLEARKQREALAGQPAAGSNPVATPAVGHATAGPLEFIGGETR